MTLTNKSTVSDFFLLLAIQKMAFARSITPSQVSGTVFIFHGNDSTFEIRYGRPDLCSFCLIASVFMLL